MGKFAQAIADLDQVIRLRPAYPPAYLQRGLFNAMLEQKESALRDFDKVLSLQPRNSQALLFRGYTLITLNRKNEAMESFRKSCEAGDPQGCKKWRVH